MNEEERCRSCALHLPWLRVPLASDSLVRLREPWPLSPRRWLPGCEADQARSREVAVRRQVHARAAAKGQAQARGATTRERARTRGAAARKPEQRQTQEWARGSATGRAHGQGTATKGRMQTRGAAARRPAQAQSIAAGGLSLIGRRGRCRAKMSFSTWVGRAPWHPGARPTED